MLIELLLNKAVHTQGSQYDARERSTDTSEWINIPLRDDLRCPELTSPTALPGLFPATALPDLLGDFFSASPPPLSIDNIILDNTTQDQLHFCTSPRTSDSLEFTLATYGALQVQHTYTRLSVGN